MKPILEAAALFSFSTGILLSPDMLALAGQFFGQTGYSGILIAAACGLIYLIMVNSFYRLADQPGHDRPGHAKDAALFSSFAGPGAAGLPIFIKMAAAAFLSTGFLVSSGFVFNEVFVYWFPNFGFAFILLGFILCLQFLKDQIRQYFQLGFTGIAVAGLFAIMISGVWNTGTAGGNNLPTADLSGNINLQWVILPLLFFIGFDLGGFHSRTPRAMRVTLLFMALILISWGITALAYVPADKLAGSSISHMVTARYVSGQTGRIIMGVIVIFGTLAAINALFSDIQAQIRHFLRLHAVPRFTFIPRLLIIFLCVLVGLFMVKGIAGEEILETCIRGTLILWMLFYGWCGSLEAVRNVNSPQKGLYRRMLIPFFLMLVWGTAIISLILTDSHPVFLITFISVLLGFFLAAGIWLNRQSLIQFKTTHRSEETQ